MDFLPIFLDIKGHTILVEGDDTVAARRIERALSCGAHVKVFDPDPKPEVQAFLDHERVAFHPRLPEHKDAKGCTVIYGASEDPERDARLREWASAEGILCNIADAPDLCDFITPSIVDRSPIVVALSTGGAAPVIARTLRARIEANLPATFGKMAKFTSAFRDRIAATIKGGRERRHFWENMIDGPAGDFFLAGDAKRAEAQILSDLDDIREGRHSDKGEVYLVGAGPGDPDLLTFRALRLMQRCDVVLYDRLVNEDILALVRRDAERINVGKLPQAHTMAQEDISELMARLALEGNRVLRLKGGDPFIFGRGGEEIETLMEHGVDFQVVPGITAAAGCGAYAGIPLTHRDHAQACLFITAHGRDGVLDLDWDVLCRKGQTVAVYMGLSNLTTLADGFEKRGLDLQTPVAVVENGTRANQIVVTGTLGDIDTRVKEAALKGPAIIIIGSVVNLRDKLNWAGVDGDDHRMSLTSKTKLEM
ncbi:MAG: siroheme synthase CysG [Brevirhabdus sp.]